MTPPGRPGLDSQWSNFDIFPEVARGLFCGPIAFSQRWSREQLPDPGGEMCMRAFATTLSLLLTSSILPLSSPLLGQPVPVRAFDAPLLYDFNALGPDGMLASAGWRAGSSEASLSRNLQPGSVQAVSPGAYNVPGSESSDRALGFLQAKGRPGVIDVRFRNATGAPIDAVTIGFDAIQWKFSPDTRSQSGLELLFSSDGQDFVSLGDRFTYHAVPDLDFRSLVSKNQSVRAVAHVSGRWILPAVLPPDREFILRWRSTNSQIEGVGFAVDNVEFIAHPVVPTTDGDGFAGIHNPALYDSRVFFPGMPQSVVLSLRGRPGGSLTTITVVPPSGWIVGETGIELVGPAFEEAELVAGEDHITIQNADLTDVKGGEIRFQECVPPGEPTGGQSEFQIFTSTTDRPGLGIQEFPRPALLSLVSALGRRDRSLSADNEVAIAGVVLCQYSFDNTQGEFYLDEDGSGIRVIFEEQDLSFAENQKVLVYGRFVLDRGRPTILASEFFAIGTGRAVSPRASIREVLANPRLYEGSLLTLRNVRRARGSAAAWPPGVPQLTRYVLTDNDGRDSLLLAAYPPSHLEESAEPKFPTAIRGILVRAGTATSGSPSLVLVARGPSDLSPVLTPPLPEVLRPAEGEKNLPIQPTLEWAPVSDATSYHIQLAYDSAFTSVILEDSTLTVPMFVCPSLKSEGAYYWRVRGRNTDGAGPFSPPRMFETVMHPTLKIVDATLERTVVSGSVKITVERSGFWYGGDPDVPQGMMEHQRGVLKLSVGNSVQGFYEKDSLWVLRLKHGENVVTAELVDRERRPLRPPVRDSLRITVEPEALVLRLMPEGDTAPSPRLYNSSSLTVHPQVRQGPGMRAALDAPPLTVTLDGRSVALAKDGSVSLTAMSPGLHWIRAELTDGEGLPVDPRNFDEFSVMIPDSAPYVRISSPAAGDTLSPSQGSVVLVRRNLHRTESSESPQSGTLYSAFLLSVDGSPVDTSAADTLTVAGLVEGAVLLRIEALDARGKPFDPPVFDEVKVIGHLVAQSGDMLEELKAYTLEQNYPNPFNAETEIRFSLPVAGHVTVRVFNLLGQEVVLLLDSDLEAGPHTVRWNALNNSGKRVSSGIYMVRLQSGPYVGTRRMLLVK